MIFITINRYEWPQLLRLLINGIIKLISFIRNNNNK